MIRKLLLSAGLTLALTAPALADTAIVPGLTGVEGAVPNRADRADKRVQPERELGVERREGSESISGDAKGAASVIKEDAPRSVTHPSSPDATGTTRGSGARGRIDSAPSGGTRY